MANSQQSDSVDVPDVTMSNTKKELLEAYEKAREAVHRKEAQLLTAEQARSKAEKQAAVSMAKRATENDPVRRLHDIRSDVGRQLSDVAEKIEEQIAMFAQVELAVTEKQGELEQLFGIETAAGDLVALIQAQDMRKEGFEEEMASRKAGLEAEMLSRKAELEADISGIRQAWANETQQRAADEEEQAAEMTKQRKREKDDFEYALKREQEQRKNALDDELGALEKEITTRRNEFEVDLATRTKELNEREEAAATREKEFEALVSRVDAFPDELAVKVEAAIEATTERLTVQAAARQELMQARFDGEKNVLQGKIDALQALVQEQRTQLSSSMEKQERAYEKVQDIANRAVAAAKHDIITMPAQAQTKPTSASGE